MSRRGEFLDAKVYIGGLPEDATTQEIEDAFHRFGRIRKVWVARRPPGFAFVEFEDSRDAEDAVKAMDGNRICGVRARVELSHGRRRNGAGNQGGGSYGRGSGGGGGGPPSSRRHFVVFKSNFSSSSLTTLRRFASTLIAPIHGIAIRFLIVPIFSRHLPII
ncbi:RRM domain-containing protein [Aphelenchoides besseyi]|nr:RRM domain-containing protein [Aphelenchoides besseyi]